MRNYFISRLFLSRQRELHGESEVAGGGGIAAGGEQRGVGLALIVERHGEQARQRVVGHEGNLQCRIATAGCRGAGGYVAGDGSL